MLRLLFATDLHGDERSHRRLLELARAQPVDAVVLGGDLLPHVGRARDPVALQRAFIAQVLRPALAELADAPEPIPVYAILGNDDFAACTPDFAELERDGLLVHVHGRAVPLATRGGGAAPLSIAGCSYVPLTPFWMSDFDRFDAPGWEPSEYPDAVLLSDGGAVRRGTLDELRARPTIEDELAALARLSDPRRTVYVVHSPPHGTALDVLTTGEPIGSAALRRFIETHQPPLTLHGHIHESPIRSGRIHDRLGATLSVNPGASVGGLRAALVELVGSDGSAARDEREGAARAPRLLR